MLLPNWKKLKLAHDLLYVFVKVNMFVFRPLLNLVEVLGVVFSLELQKKSPIRE